MDRIEEGPRVLSSPMLNRGLRHGVYVAGQAQRPTK